MKFFKCNKCGRVAIELVSGAGKMVCCGEEMEELKANSTDAAVEKHVPVVTKTDTGIEVTVGEAEHPMTEEHQIDAIIIDKGCGYYVKPLDPGKPAHAIFDCNPDKVKAVYAYCNLHGLWAKEF